MAARRSRGRAWLLAAEGVGSSARCTAVLGRRCCWAPLPLRGELVLLCLLSSPSCTAPAGVGCARILYAAALVVRFSQKGDLSDALNADAAADIEVALAMSRAGSIQFVGGQPN
eukprot:5322024-Lingulodinium_polyedra.AAC.1